MEVDLFGNVLVKEDKPEKVKPRSPFDFIKDIGNKDYPNNMEGYVPWIVNNSLSMRKDTVFHSNEMNKYHFLSDREQFDFYFYSLGGRNLFAKYLKASKKDLKAIQEYYGVSSRVAETYQKVLTDEQVNAIQSWYDNSKGGK